MLGVYIMAPIQHPLESLDFMEVAYASQIMVVSKHWASAVGVHVMKTIGLCPWKLPGSKVLLQNLSTTPLRLRILS